MTMTRRSFLRGAAVAAAVAPAIPLVLAKGNAATLAPTVETVDVWPIFFAEHGVYRMEYVGKPTMVRWSASNDAGNWDFRDFGATTIANNGA